MIRPDDIIKWIETNLVVVSGHDADKPVVLLTWAKRFIRGVFRKGVTTASVSMARANAKSSVCSYIACAALWGPLAKPNSTIAVVASSLEQARIIFQQVCYQLPDGGVSNRDRWRVWDSASAVRITDRETGCTLKCLSSDPKMAHGLISHLWLLDEPAQYQSTKVEKMVNAAITSAGKIKDAKVIFLGTRPESDEHPFSKLLDGDADYALEYRSRARKTWWSEAAMRAANPALSRFPVLKEQIKRERDLARRDPRARARYFSYRLNAGTPEVVDQRDQLLTVEQYKALEGPACVQQPYCLGVDLSSSWAQSGFAAVSLAPDAAGRYHCDVFSVWPEIPNLQTRTQADGVEYLPMHAAGELVLVPGRTVKVDLAVAEAFERWGMPEVIVCDRWRFSELQDVVAPFGFFEGENLITRRAGFFDGGADVSNFMRMALDRNLVFPESQLLKYSMAAARTISDPGGNTKLAKANERNTKGRDDAVAALVISAAEVHRSTMAPVSTGFTITHVPLGAY